MIREGARNGGERMEEEEKVRRVEVEIRKEWDRKINR